MFIEYNVPDPKPGVINLTMNKVSIVPAFILSLSLYFTDIYGGSQSMTHMIRPENTMINKIISWFSSHLCSLNFFLSPNSLFYTNFGLYN